MTKNYSKIFKKSKNYLTLKKINQININKNPHKLIEKSSKITEWLDLLTILHQKIL